MSTTEADARRRQKKPRRKKSADGMMGVAQHLAELRDRLLRAVLAVLLGAVAGWFVTPWILGALRAPVTALSDAAGGHVAELNFPVITGAFDLRLQIAITAGIVIASPIWLWQVWAFIVPGLVRKERAYAVGFLGTAIPLSLGGCAAGWYVLPHIVGMLGGFVSTQDTSIIDAKAYYDFVVKLIVAIGIAFVLPVFLVLANSVGILSALAMLKAWRITVLAILVFTAIVTPPPT